MAAEKEVALLHEVLYVVSGKHWPGDIYGDCASNMLCCATCGMPTDVCG